MICPPGKAIIFLGRAKRKKVLMPDLLESAAGGEGGAGTAEPDTAAKFPPAIPSNKLSWLVPEGGAP